MAAIPPIDAELGRPAPDFTLDGIDGRRWSLADVRGEKGTLVAFICNHCPYVKASIDRLVRDAGELAAHGVRTIAIMPNDTEAYPADSFENMALFAEQHRFVFPYVIDRTQQVAKAYGAVCTPDFFGFDADLMLRYRGRLDAGRAQPIADAPRDLFNAMVSIAHTGEAPGDQVPSMGCSIKWRPGMAG